MVQVSDEERDRIVAKAKSGEPITKEEFENYLDSYPEDLLGKAIQKAVKAGVFDKKNDRRKI